MQTKKPPARMGRYANLSSIKKASHPKRSGARHKGRFAWFRNLSWRKKTLVLLSPLLIFLIATPIITYVMYAHDIADQERLMNRNNTGIVLTDINGKTFYSVGRAEHRALVPLSQISDNVKHALIASEDKDFYKHGGFNLLSTVRALFTGVGGGSTITQQLAKNTLLSDERSIFRKYQELTMSIAIEQTYTKDQILDMYLNSVYFGENAFGIEEAARVYFNKSPSDLDLAESAMLIGLLPAPSAYSPISGNTQYAKRQQTTVLSRMVTNGYITEEQKSAALAEELKYGAGASQVNSVAPHFAEMVIAELSEKYGYEKVMRSGYQVKTTLDLSTQQTLQESLNAGMGHITAMGGSNASGIVIDPKTGEVRALIGSADYNNPQWGKVNMVTTARQPASTFKSIYYAYALADGVITPATILHDVKTTFGGDYTPLDADKKERGDISVRRAISQSLNIPSVEVMQKYSIDKSIVAANNLGVSAVSKDKNYGLSLALGSAEVPLEQMANAYAAFANGGKQYSKLTLIKEINDKFGGKVESSPAVVRQAISKEGAYLISSILSDNSARAPIFGSSLTVPGRTVAVKTGTTNDNRDAWTIGYTEDYVVGVWVGNNDNSVMRSGGSDMAGPIWRNTMKKLLVTIPDKAFTMPSSIVQKSVCTKNGGLAEKSGPNTYTEYFMSGALPTETCNAEPTMISVCELSSGKVISIDETAFDTTKQSKDTTNCIAPKMQVCDLSNGTIVSIDAATYTTYQYSTDTANCHQDPGANKIQACDTSIGQVVTIYQSQLDGTRYTSDTANCNKV